MSQEVALKSAEVGRLPLGTRVEGLKEETLKDGMRRARHYNRATLSTCGCTSYCNR